MDDPAADLSRVYREVAERSARLFAERLAKEHEPQPLDEFGIGRAYMDLWSAWLANPAKLVEKQYELGQQYAALWQSSWLRMLGQEAPAVAAPAKGDNRFRAEDWQTNFLFDFFKQSYLIAAKGVHEAVAGTELTPESKKKVEFFTRQFIDALAPSNFALTNPTVIKETLATNGANLVHGLNNLLKDIEAGDGELRVKMVDEKAFELGRNVATMPGKVVYQTDLMQLLQFAPTTERVFRQPLLIIPPWINKYYILDLRAENSFIRWATSQGHTVFVVSWVNPDAKLASKTFDDYLTEGALAAIDAVEKATGEKKINLIGYCLGGTLLGCALAHMAAKKDKRAHTATFFVSLLDFSQPGELGVFIDEQQVEALERRMAKQGYLDGSEMAGTFNLLRSNDLVWSFVVNNYLLGREPMPFDLLYWNSDSTRMPAKMHSFYLRNMYMKNALREPGGVTLAGVKLDLSEVKVPAYFISTVEDHIAPWQSTYKGALALGGPVRFVLGGSGHIAGIVNPPAANKYCYWTGDELLADPAAWQAAATRHDGSWWNDWQAWIGAANGPARVAARVPGRGKLKAIEDAPGSYAKVRLKKAG